LRCWCLRPVRHPCRSPWHRYSVSYRILRTCRRLKRWAMHPLNSRKILRQHLQLNRLRRLPHFERTPATRSAKPAQSKTSFKTIPFVRQSRSGRFSLHKKRAPSAGQLGPSGVRRRRPGTIYKNRRSGDCSLVKSGPGELEANRGRRQRGNPRRLGPAVPITTGSTAVWFNILIDKAASPSGILSGTNRLFVLMIGSHRQSSASLRKARPRVWSGARLVIWIGPSLSKRAG
jgi:hypothetical protein